jgi:DNA-binding NtrC family response regulator
MKHILVIDDERDILTCLEEALSGEGYRVTGVVSGAEALDLLARDAPDLVMLDLRMPDINGIEVLQRLRRTHPKLPVIVCSALTSYRTDFDIVTGNVGAFLEKPLDLDEVVQTVGRLLAPSPPPQPPAQPSQPNA